MTYSFEVSEELQKTLDKLSNRDPKLATEVRKKIAQIIASDKAGIEHFKNLRGNMSHLKRVHVGSFVLVFQVKGNTAFFESLTHHDEAYK